MDILALEDSRLSLKLLGMATRGHATIHSAATLTEGKNMLLKREYDLIIVELILEDGTGQEFIPYIRRNALNENVPILVVSSSLTLVTQYEISLLGANDWLNKQSRPAEVLNVILSLFKNPYSRLPSKKYSTVQTVIWHELDLWSAYIIGQNMLFSHTCEKEADFLLWLKVELAEFDLPTNISIPKFSKLSTVLLD